MQVVDWAKIRNAREKRIAKKSRKRANVLRKEAAAKNPPIVIQKTDPNRFYLCRPWRELRYQALKQNDGRCELCGASKHDGATLHVDHILPRSKFPKLQLELTNLQVLCADCNIGKSNLDATDWRKTYDEWAWMDERLENIKGKPET